MTLSEVSEKRPGDGCEVSYLEMEVDSEQTLFKLLEGKATAVQLTDRFEQPREPFGNPTVMQQG